MRPSIDPGCRCSSQVKTEKSRAGSNATRLTWRPSTSEGTIRCGATTATPGVAAIRSIRPAGKVSSVGCTVSRLEVMFTRVRAGNDDEIGPHARKARRDPLVQRPAGDEAREANADTEHDGESEKHRPQPAPPDVLRRQSDQQQAILPVSHRLTPAFRLFAAATRSGMAARGQRAGSGQSTRVRRRTSLLTADTNNESATVA